MSERKRTGRGSPHSKKDPSQIGQPPFGEPLLSTDPVLVSETNQAARQIEDTDTNRNSAYIPIALRSFLVAEKAHFDIYIKISEQKYLKVLKANQTFEADRLKRYEGHNIDTLYLKPQDYIVYVEQCLSLSRAALARSSQVAPIKRLPIVTNVAEAVFNQLLFHNVDDNALKSAMTVTHDLVEVLETHRELGSVLESLKNIGVEFTRHSVGVSAFATIIAYTLGWQGYSTLSSLALAGLLHDIGFKELPPEIRSKPRANFTPEELALYQTHPERSKEILGSLTSIPAIVVAMVAEHHEKPNGHGFPNQLRFDKILPLSRFIAFADVLAHEFLPSDPGAEQTPHQLLVRVEHLHRHDFPPDYFKALHKFVEPAKKYHL